MQDMATLHTILQLLHTTVMTQAREMRIWGSCPGEGEKLLSCGWGSPCLAWRGAGCGVWWGAGCGVWCWTSPAQGFGVGVKFLPNAYW